MRLTDGEVMDGDHEVLGCWDAGGWPEQVLEWS